LYSGIANIEQYDPLFSLKHRGFRLFRLETDSNAVYILPKEFYSEEYTFFGHSQGGTWHGKDVETILWLLDRRWIVLGISALLAGLGVFFCCVKPYMEARARRLRGYLAAGKDDDEEHGEELRQLREV
jgi:hypothetical protein